VNTCDNCGEPLVDGGVFCPECGTPVNGGGTAPEPEAPVVRCPECGTELTAGLSFCEECGTELIETQKDATTPVTQSRVDPAHAFRDAAREAYDGESGSATVGEELEHARVDLGLDETAARQIEAEIRQDVERSAGPLGEYVKLEIDATKSLYAGQRGTVDLRVSNLSGKPIRGVRASVACQSIERKVSKELKGRSLGPNDQRPLSLPVSPHDMGEDILDIELEYVPKGGNRQFLVGEAKVWVIDKDELRAGGGSRNISINIEARDLTAVDMTGVASHTETDGMNPEELIRFMRETGDPIWMQVALYPDEDRIDSEGASGTPLALIDPPTPVPVTRGVTLSVASPDGLPTDRIKAFSKPEVAVGRLTRNDICLRKEPVGGKGGDNWNASNQVSGTHFTFGYNGTSFDITDQSTNGTCLSSRPGEALASNQPTPVANGEIIQVARVLDLRVDMALKGEQDDLLVGLRKLSVPWSNEPAVGPQAYFGLNGTGTHAWIRLRRDNNPTGEDYLIVVSSADIGSSGDCAWVLEHPSIQKRHARIVYHQSRYLLHGMNGAPVIVNGRVLAANEVAVLGEDTVLQLGMVQVRVGNLT
jgi:uncharacterized Zn finger protein (UPF0148 family)